MSVLAPLFLLGGLAIALPVIFHLIRRQPRGRIAFSSLMFLEASPPRLNRRSRVDDWLLLLLRGLAVLLVAAAFTRPFLRSSAIGAGGSVERYLVILIDRSASMRRGDLWQQAIETAIAEAESLRPTDRVAWLAFDTDAEVLQDFAAGASEDRSASNAGTMRAALSGISPTWRAGDLGTALTAAADLLDDATRNLEVADVERTVVLISDMQAGSSLAALHGYQWPESTQVRIAPIAGKSSSNATIAGADPAVEQDTDDFQSPASTQGLSTTTTSGFRISVSSAADSTIGQFSVRWVDAGGSPRGTTAASVTVPPGTMRASRLGAPPLGAIAVELVGDDHAFDNRRYVTVPKAMEQTVLFVGEDAEDPRESLLYYLQRVSLDRPGHTVSVERQGATDPLGASTSTLELTPKQVPLIVLASAPSASLLAELERYLDSGGRILIVVDSAATNDGAAHGAAQNGAVAQAAQALSGDPSLRIATAEIDDYALLTQIDFANALFEPLADPRYSDFAKIQFWAHQKITVDDPQAWQTLARFDDGDPALLERSVGSGKLWVLAAGWQPTESQLALSTKFVPIIAGMARDIQREEISAAAVVGEAWTLPPSETAEIVTPAGQRIPYRTLADSQAIDAPGIYQYRDGETEQPVAVNIAAGESQTEPLDRSVLEQLGVQFTDQQRAERQAQVARQLRDVELEKQQQWWRVLLLAGLAMIGLETLLSSRARSARNRSTVEGVQ